MQYLVGASRWLDGEEQLSRRAIAENTEQRHVGLLLLKNFEFDANVTLNEQLPYCLRLSQIVCRELLKNS